MNDNPVFDFAFVCGRYSHAHLGHNMLINKGLQLSRKMYVAVGSAQEKGTLRNPFCVETRIRTIREMYPDLSEDKLIVGGINDLSNEFNRSTTWGTYLKQHIIEKFGKFPDLILYGTEETRSNWFEESDMVNTHELLVPRGIIPISATMVRGFLVIDDEDSWYRNNSENIYHLYSDLREELMDTPVYKEIYDKMLKTGRKDMDTFMSIYKEYAELDKLSKLYQLKKMQK